MVLHQFRALSLVIRVEFIDDRHHGVTETGSLHPLIIIVSLIEHNPPEPGFAYCLLVQKYILVLIISLCPKQAAAHGAQLMAF